MDWLWDALSALDLSFPRSVIGGYFEDVLGVLSVLFGGTLLLFAWRHHDYFLGVTGFLAGSFLGLLFKSQVVPEGAMAHFLYIMVCGVGMAAAMVMFKRIVGMALGGFITALVVVMVRPDLMEGGQGNAATLAMAFLLGGGLGALFPRMFYIATTALFGAAFATYGITQTLVPVLLPDLAASRPNAMHAMVFLPLMVFGLGYQVFSTRQDAPPKLRPVGDPAG